MTLKNKTSSPTPTLTQTPIPMHGDNFDFIGMAEPLRLPLTDMECALIDNLFLYSHLCEGVAFEYNGQTYSSTPTLAERCKPVFDLLVKIVSQDERAVDKMDDYLRLKSLSADTVTSHTTKGGTQ